MKHVHHEKYLQALKEIEETGTSEWEWKSKRDERWYQVIFDSGNSPSFDRLYEYRKPLKKRYLKRSELPEPVREALKMGDAYYCPSVADRDKYIRTRWYYMPQDHDRFKLGIIYLTPEDAIAHTEALLATETE